MKAFEQVALLFDFYGPLLTDRQQELVRAYYQEDLSLGEIAEVAQISRQAVHDQIKRAELSLAEYESRLGLVAEHLHRQAALAALAEQLRQAAAALSGSPAGAQVTAAVHTVQNLMSGDAVTHPIPAGPARERSNGTV